VFLVHRPPDHRNMEAAAVTRTIDRPIHRDRMASAATALRS
jgi:hypothetical protein